MVSPDDYLLLRVCFRSKHVMQAKTAAGTCCVQQALTDSWTKRQWIYSHALSCSLFMVMWCQQNQQLGLFSMPVASSTNSGCPGCKVLEIFRSQLGWQALKRQSRRKAVDPFWRSDKAAEKRGGKLVTSRGRYSALATAGMVMIHGGTLLTAPTNQHIVS